MFVLTAALLAVLGIGSLSAQEARLIGTPVAQAIEIRGGGPVLQILPGPAPFGEEALRFLRSRPGEMPQEKMQQMRQIARKGPFSNQVAQIQGDFAATFVDSGETGDRVTGTSEFTTEDGTQWRVVFTGVDPSGNPPMEPHWGGVAAFRLLHGTSGHHNPFVPTVNSIAMWGTADVFRNGEQVKNNAPVHVMLTSDTRGENFNYKCYQCVGNEMEELHMMLMPKGDTDPYAAPGGFLHIMWEKARYDMEPVL